MIPVTQTKVVVNKSTGENVIRGNCFAACVASLMELPIEEVPNVEVLFHIEGGYWSEVMMTFLTSKGYELYTDDRFKCFHQDFEDKNFGGKDNYEGTINELKDQYYLVSGQSVRGVYHICIFKNGKLIHDPHPTREGLKSMEIFQTLDKTK